MRDSDLVSECDERTLHSRAVRLLAKREHSKAELRRKLATHDADAALIERVLETLTEGNLLSDGRFVDEFVRSRIARGRGPLRIRADLEGRGIADEVIDAALTHPASFWLERLHVVREKKFGSTVPADRADWGRQARFLAQRGFPADLIYRSLDAAE